MKAHDSSAVGETAIGAAMMRARESARSNALFHDPLASAFVEAAPPIFEDGPSAEDDPEIAALEEAFEEAVIVRTRFFDVLVVDAVSTGCRQVVLVGAGLDTRAFRLGLPPQVRVYELDTPEVLSFKNRVLLRAQADPQCERIVVPLDLASPTWPHTLLHAGFEQASSSTWVLEGVIPYLSPDETQRLLVAIAEHSAVGSRLGFDHEGGGPEDPLNRARVLPSMSQIAGMWKGGLGGNAEALLERIGWSAEIVSGETLRQRYLRSQRTNLIGVMVSAVRVPLSS